MRETFGKKRTLHLSRGRSLSTTVPQKYIYFLYETVYLPKINYGHAAFLLPLKKFLLNAGNQSITKG
jgi:hypothetical protein